MRRIPQKLFSAAATSAKGPFNPLQYAAEHLVDKRKLFLELLKRSLAEAVVTFDRITSSQNSNMTLGDAFDLSKKYFTDVESILEATHRINITELTNKERAQISEAYSSLAHFKYKTNPETPDIKENIKQALIFNPCNEQAQHYKLELGISYSNPNPK
jgi:hypothetical protein